METRENSKSQREKPEKEKKEEEHHPAHDIGSQRRKIVIECGRERERGDR